MSFTDYVTDLDAAELEKKVETHDGTTGVKRLSGYFSVSATPTAYGYCTTVTLSKLGTGRYKVLFPSAFTNISYFNALVHDGNLTRLGAAWARVQEATNTYLIIAIQDSAGSVLDDVDYIAWEAEGV